MKTRTLLQSAFLALTAAAVFLVGANAERWCPFGGVEAAYTYLHEGSLTCSLGVSNFYILGGLILATLLLRRVFCGYACPIGTLSEWIRAGGRLLKIPRVRVPPALDAALSLLKYAVLAVILFFTWRAGELVFRGYDPCYALISRHGEDITFWAYVVAGSIAAASLFLTVPFCRWFCPLAAVLNPLARFAPARVRRGAEACIDCGLCARACPMAIPVDEAVEVKHSRCTLCLDCVDACPENEEGALALAFAPAAGASRAPAAPAAAVRRGPRRAVVIAVLLLCLTGSVAAAYLFPLPSFVKVRGEPPGRTAAVELEIEGLKCRGTATLFVYFLERDDELEIPGYLEVEAWPAPGSGRARIVFDPERTGPEAIKAAITEPYYDYDGDTWRTPPFVIAGYDPLGLRGGGIP